MFRTRVTRRIQGNCYLVPYLWGVLIGVANDLAVFTGQSSAPSQGFGLILSRPRQFPMKQQLSMFEEIAKPSPVRCLERTQDGSTLWLKDDSRIHPVYGGNKCRKLAHLLGDAEHRNKSRITTVGTAGSHHVLATGLLGKSRGFAVRAFVISQPWSAHAERVLCASVASGIELIPALSPWGAFRAATQLGDSTSTFIPPGGSNVCGSLGYFEAAIELAEQVKNGELPEPDYIVAALGTAGTIAGLLAGAQYAGLKSIVVGVSVLKAVGRSLYARRLANSILRSMGSASTVKSDRLFVDSRWLGAGYGYASESGSAATTIAASLDLPLDPTYTAKAFAGALSLLNGKKTGPNANVSAPNMAGSPLHVLYWHTLNASNPDIQEAARAKNLPQNLSVLLRACPEC